eukprot:scaffold25714_cov30-Tisochrysis_lutea.AAC.1
MDEHVAERRGRRDVHFRRTPGERAHSRALTAKRQRVLALLQVKDADKGVGRSRGKVARGRAPRECKNRDRLHWAAPGSRRHRTQGIEERSVGLRKND